ncbi:MAG: c-type cytochrome biogenesis protein CcsB, partial [Thermobispora bispora]|nr:c-type cytochrome biogenesis protein CcsB [Thermobispora bispora]
MTPLVNEELATLSDQLTLVAVLLYLVAMICFALDLAFGRIHPASAVKAREPVAVGAGGGGPSSGEPGEAAAAVAYTHLTRPTI